MAWWQKLFGADAGTIDGLSPLRFPQVPAYHEVIHEELAVRVYAHDFPLGGRLLPCWSYVTDGMRRQGQKEFVLTLQRRPTDTIENYPEDPFRLFQSIHNLAIQGKKVDLNDFTQFRLPNGFLDQKGLVGIAYTKSEKILGVNYAETPLAAILLTSEEAEILSSMGTYRILTMLGHRERYYPTPPWSNRDRKSVISKKDISKSMLSTMPIANAPWASVRLHLSHALSDDSSSDSHHTPMPSSEDRLILKMKQAGREFAKNILAQIPLAQSFAWIVSPAAEADSRLVWIPDGLEVEAIIPPESKGVCQTGGFIGFMPTEELPEGGQLIEDGFVIWLRPDSMRRLREALMLGARYDLNTGPNRVRFFLQWEQATHRSNPIEIIKLLLYQQEVVINQRVPETGALLTYANRIQQTLLEYFEALPEAIGRDFLLVTAVRPDSEVRFWIEITPDLLDPQITSELENQLREVPVPKVVGGPVAQAMFAKLWGGTGQEVQPTQMVPQEWRRAVVQLGGKGVLPDDILRIIWPMSRSIK
jgi:hypothetical protein